MGSGQMARHCHTQMPTSYLAHLCQDKTHEAGMALSSRRNKICGETVTKCTCLHYKHKVSDQQTFMSLVLSCLAQRHKGNTLCLFGPGWPVYADLQLEIIQNFKWYALYCTKNGHIMNVMYVCIKENQERNVLTSSLVARKNVGNR